MKFSTSLGFAKQLDQQDSLASYRSRFVTNDPDLIYLDGNSLGRLPKSVIGRAKKAVEAEWGTDLIRGWNKGWWGVSRAYRRSDWLSAWRGIRAGCRGRSNLDQLI